MAVLVSEEILAARCFADDSSNKVAIVTVRSDCLGEPVREATASTVALGIATLTGLPGFQIFGF